jgi:hypothetical protein
MRKTSPQIVYGILNTRKSVGQLYCRGVLTFAQTTRMSSDVRPAVRPPSPQVNSKTGNTIVNAAAIIAAVRLAREPELGNSPRVLSAISQSVALAERIYRRVRECSRISFDYSDPFDDANRPVEPRCDSI